MILTPGKIMSRKNDFERNKGEPFKKPNKTEFLGVSLAKNISMKGLLRPGYNFWFGTKWTSIIIRYKDIYAVYMYNFKYSHQFGNIRTYCSDKIRSVG